MTNLFHSFGSPLFEGIPLVSSDLFEEKGLVAELSSKIHIQASLCCSFDAG